MSRLTKTNMWKSTAGYTIDQTILIVAIIAILVTIIIISVGWALLSKAGGSKLASQLRQIEDANGQFYADQHLWVYQAITTPSAVNNMLALTGTPTAAWQSAVNTNEIKNLVPGFRVAGTAVNHSFGAGGAITLQYGTPNATQNTSVPSANTYLVVQFASVPVAEADRADQAIDGAADYKTGRLVYSTASCVPAAAGGAMPNITPATAPTTGSVNVCYIANLIQ